MDYPQFIRDWKNPGLSEIEARTSGSTGKPKLIRLPKTLMRQSAIRTIEFFGLNSGSALHSCISPEYIGGKMMAVRAMECGARFSYEPPSNRPALPLAENGSLDLVAVVPSQVWHILALPHASRCRLLIGGSAIPDTLRDAIAASGIECWESYGMTETASHIALRRVERIPGAFFPLKGIRISRGEERNMVISLGEGYPEIATNDIVSMHPDGGFEILGRLDNVIISGGIKIIPEDVERRIAPILAEYGFRHAMISSEEDAKWGRKVVLVLESTLPHNLPEENILARIRPVLAPYEMPKEVIFVDSIPLTGNGKPIRSGVLNKVLRASLIKNVNEEMHRF